VVGLDFHVRIARKLSAIRDVRADPVLIGATVKRLAELGLTGSSKIGVVGYFQGLTLPVEHDHAVRAVLPDALFKDVTQWFQDLRLVKSEEEIELLKQAGKLSDRVHYRVFDAIEPHARRSDICRLVGIETLTNGGSWALSHVGSTSMTDPDDYYPDFYATNETIEPGHFCQTEFAIGYGNYFLKSTTTSFVGDPTEEFKALFHSAADVQNRCIDGLKPGMTGADCNRYLEPLAAAGFHASQPLIGGFSIYNTSPWSGAIEGSPMSLYFTKPYDNFVFEPGHSLFIIGTPFIPGTRKGLWVGQTCLMTDHGLERLSTYPVDQLRIVPT
jgi:Xaa-Pro aminopeptidase